MQDLSSEDILKLKEIFFGEPRQPQTAWLLPVQEPIIDICGKGIRREDDSFFLDIGSIPVMETANESVYVANLTQQSLLVWVDEVDEHISAQWENNTTEAFIAQGGVQNRLDLSFYDDASGERDFSKKINISAEMETGIRKEFYLFFTGKSVVTPPPEENGKDDTDDIELPEKPGESEDLPAGKACFRCHMVSCLEIPYCSLCGYDIREAPPVPGAEVMTCQACGREYTSSIGYCPDDGKPLVKKILGG
ncbi:MAG: hypothetical protein KAW12_17115 [Candidatus Aminicenantes bacterium]|nr:hypothetical protein [Candidatus Aminicenantes bacterium]